MTSDDASAEAARFGFRALEPEPRGWLARLLKKPDPGGATRAVEGALAGRSWDELTPEAIIEILRESRVTALQVRDGMVGLYRRAVEASLRDSEITPEDRVHLGRLAMLLGLEAGSAFTEEATLAEAKYRETVQTALSDRWLSDEEKANLSALAGKLKIPPDRIEALHRELFGGALQSAFDEAIADRRLSPEEEQRLDRLAQNLGGIRTLIPAGRTLPRHRCRASRRSRHP